MEIDIEDFKRAVADDIQRQYPKVDYLSSTIPLSMDEHKGLIKIDNPVETTTRGANVQEN